MAEAVLRRTVNNRVLKDILNVSSEDLSWKERLRRRFWISIQPEPIQKVTGKRAECAHARSRHIEQVLVPDCRVRKPPAGNSCVDEINMSRLRVTKQMCSQHRSGVPRADYCDSRWMFIRVHVSRLISVLGGNSYCNCPLPRQFPAMNNMECLTPLVAAGRAAKGVQLILPFAASADRQ